MKFDLIIKFIIDIILSFVVAFLFYFWFFHFVCGYPFKLRVVLLTFICSSISNVVYDVCYFALAEEDKDADDDSESETSGSEVQDKNDC